MRLYILLNKLNSLFRVSELVRTGILFLLISALLIGSVIAQNVYKLDLSKPYQTIHGFGASDAWSNMVLNRMSDSARNVAADWLFSKEMNPDGSCKGIGLSVWRFNLGAGSAEQGDSSGIGNPERRVESFLNADGTYNFEKQAGTQGLLKAAKSRGVENLILFSNSPPVGLTRNGKAFSDVCGKCNLAPENYEAFAEYITQSLKYFDREQIHFDYVSPVNEPQWGWCRSDGQEGNPYLNMETAGLVKAINRKFIDNEITTKIQIPESGLLVFATPGGYKFKPGRQNEMNSFFKEGKSTYIGDQTHVARQICSHSYFTEWPLWISRKVRKRVARVSERRDLEFWMTEYCILKTTREISGGGRDLGMHTALYVSRIIHHDLVFGNAASWSWWLGISTANYKDGLVYVNSDGSGLTDSKLMWAMGNFSQFIRPGAMRIEVKGKKDNELMVSAYLNKGSKSLVIVVINMKSDNQTIVFEGLPKGTTTVWETSEKLSLAKKATNLGDEPFTVSPESITTLQICM